ATSSWQLEQRLERSRTAVGTAIGDGAGLNRVVVEYPVGDRSYRANIEFDTVRPGAGATVPIRYDPDDLTSAWPATGPEVVLTSLDTATFACLFGGIVVFVAAAI